MFQWFWTIFSLGAPVILRQRHALTRFGISVVPTAVCTQSNVVTLVVKRKRLAWVTELKQQKILRENLKNKITLTTSWSWIPKKGRWGICFCLLPFASNCLIEMPKKWTEILHVKLREKSYRIIDLITASTSPSRLHFAILHSSLCHHQLLFKPRRRA